MRRKGRNAIVAGACVVLRVSFAAAILGSAVTPAQTALPDYQVKAAYLYHFTQFIEWPLPTDNSPFLLCVVKDGAISAALEQLTRGKTIGSHPLKVDKLNAAAEIRACRVLFVPVSETARTQEYLQAVAESGVLTVGDHPEFRRSGGMIELFLEDQHIAFRLNIQAMQRAHLIASSRLLRLARQTETAMKAEGYR